MFRPGGRSWYPGDCHFVLAGNQPLFLWRFFKVPRLLILAGNCSISLGLTKIFVPRYKWVWWLAGGLLPYLYLGTIRTPSWRSKSVPEFKLLYVWPELTNRFFKPPKFPQNEVRDGKIIENEGGLHLGVWSLILKLKVDFDKVMEVTS